MDTLFKWLDNIGHGIGVVGEVFCTRNGINKKTDALFSKIHQKRLCDASGPDAKFVPLHGWNGSIPWRRIVSVVRFSALYNYVTVSPGRLLVYFSPAAPIAKIFM